MIKRRLDLLVPIKKEISEQYYSYVKRPCLFDVGSIYSELMDGFVGKILYWPSIF